MAQIIVSMLMKTVAFASNLLLAVSRQPIIKLMIASYFWLELILHCNAVEAYNSENDYIEGKVIRVIVFHVI